MNKQELLLMERIYRSLQRMSSLAPCNPADILAKGIALDKCSKSADLLSRALYEIKDREYSDADTSIARTVLILRGNNDTEIQG